MSLRQLTHPNNPESALDPLAQGLFLGSLVGEVTSIDDPEKKGRVKVRCKLIDPDNDLPSAEDGWIQCTEQFTVNSSAGGSHAPIQVGTIVKVDPMYPANGRSWIVSGCLPNRVDSPHPDTDRAQGTHGSVTRNQVFDVSDDRNLSHIKAFPHGVVKHVSSNGDISSQTEEGSRVFQGQDGTTTIENPKSFTTLSPEGEVTQQSRDGAVLNLKESGEVKLDSAFAQGLRLDGMMATLHGPLSAIAAAAKSLSELQGVMAQAQEVFGKLQGVADDLSLPLDASSFESFLDEASGYLEEIEGLQEHISAAQEHIATLEDASALEIGEYFTGQLGIAEDVMPIVEQITPLLESGLSGQEMMAQVMPLLSEAQVEGFDGDRLAQILDALNYDPESQYHAILDAVLPNGIEDVEALIGMEVFDQLPQIQSQLMPSNEAATGTTGVDEQAIANGRIEALREILPDWATSALRSEAVQGFIQRAIAGDAQRPTQELLGLLQQGQVQALGDSLSGFNDLFQRSQSTRDQLQGIRNGDAGKIGDIQKQFGLSSASATPAAEADIPLAPSGASQGAIAPASAPPDQASPDQQAAAQAVMQDALGGGMAEQLASATEWSSLLGDSFPAGGLGSNVMLSNMIGTLNDPTGAYSVYALTGSTGFQTPYGTMALGAAGLIMKLVNGIGGFASGLGGFSILGQNGGILMGDEGLSIASLVDPFMNDEGIVSHGGIQAQVQVVGDQVHLKAAGTNASSLRITPEGIFVGDNSTPLDQLLARIGTTERAGSA